MWSHMLGSALAEVAGPLNDFLQKLSGDGGEEWLAAFKRFLRKENPWPAAEEASQHAPIFAGRRLFPIWKPFTFGGKSKDVLLAELETGGFEVTDRANNMMTAPCFTITPEPVTVDLVQMTVAELGFPKGATTREIWAQIKECGGSLCPPDLGPSLRIAYGDQPKDEYLWVAMEQITNSDGYPGVFEVGHDDDGRWLDSGGAVPVAWWDAEYRIVFVGPRK